jgi:hypothetical protein
MPAQDPFPLGRRDFTKHLLAASVSLRLARAAFGGCATFAAVVSGSPRVAEAQTASVTKGEILVLLGTHSGKDGGGSIDPALSGLPELTKPPLNRYDTYKLLDRKLVDLVPGQTVTYAVVNGSRLELKLHDVTGDHRYHMTAIITAGGKSSRIEVTTDPEGHVFVGGQRYQGGALFLGITIKG